MVKSEVRKILDSQGLPDDAVLGHIVWFTISDGQHELNAMQNTFDRLMLDTSMLPTPTTAMNAYEKACTRIVSLAKPYDIDSKTVGQVMAVREVSRDSDTVSRQMVREIRDNDAVRLSYEPVANVDLSRGVAHRGERIDRNSHRLRATLDDTRILSSEKKQIEALITEWFKEFDRLFNYVDGDRVRKVVRSYLTFLNGVKMKDGVYFVHKTRETELLALQEFVSTLEGNCSLEVFPIPEMARLRTSVVAAWEREASESFAKVAAEVAHVRSTRGRITEAALAKVTSQYQDTMRRSTEYSRILHVKQETTAGAAEIALAALDTLRAQFQKQEETP